MMSPEVTPLLANGNASPKWPVAMRPVAAVIRPSMRRMLIPSGGWTIGGAVPRDAGSVRQKAVEMNGANSVCVDSTFGTAATKIASLDWLSTTAAYAITCAPLTCTVDAADVSGNWT